MGISVTIFVILFSICILNASLLEPVIENVVHIKGSTSPHGAPGTWKKKTVWKPRWVKEWKSAKVMKPTYKKVWSPVIIQEWIPFPKQPPEWDAKSSQLKNGDPGSNAQLSLWDPMPYPESQQPPPTGPSAPNNISPPGLSSSEAYGSGGLPDPGNPLGLGGSESLSLPKPDCQHGCRQPLTFTFTKNQIAQIIGHNRFKKETDYSESKEYSSAGEPAANARTISDRSLGFNLLQGLSNLLTSPRLLGFNFIPKSTQPPPRKPSVQSQLVHPVNHHENFNNYRQTSHSLSPPPQPPFSPLSRPPHPLPSSGPNAHLGKPQNFENFPSNIKKPSDPHKIIFHPDHHKQHLNGKHNSNAIQPAQLISEYHYSDFDVTIPGNSLRPSQGIKFKPLPSSAWSLPPIDHVKSANNKHHVVLQPVSNGKFRPIRKDSEKENSENHILRFRYKSNPPTPVESPHQKQASPSFQMEKIIAKEIIPIYNVTFPANHKFEPETTHPSIEKDNSTAATTSSDTQKPTNNDHSSQKQPIRLSEEALLKALQKNRTSQQTAALFFTPRNIYSGENSETTTETAPTTTTTTTPKSPVYIVTPTYQSSKV